MQAHTNKFKILCKKRLLLGTYTTGPAVRIQNGTILVPNSLTVESAQSKMGQWILAAEASAQTAARVLTRIASHLPAVAKGWKRQK